MEIPDVEVESSDLDSFLKEGFIEMIFRDVATSM